jgi:hypothetical protein
MHGRAAPWITLLVPVTFLAGCGLPSACEEDQEAAPSAESARGSFDPFGAGAIHGKVFWSGTPPQVAPFSSPLSPLSEQGIGPRCLWPNPNAPVIDPETKGVGNAVVFLRGVDPRDAKPWPHPPVQVELRDFQLHVRQGDIDAHTAFVRRGDTVTLVSRQEGFDSIQARGAAFFGLPLPDAHRPRTRRLDHKGLVELSSGAGHFWTRGYLFVDDHPYYAHTDRHGDFSLSGVPPGQYELVCWLPDWREAAHELDADTCLICRLTFRPPLEWVEEIGVKAGQDSAVTFRVSAK